MINNSKGSINESNINMDTILLYIRGGSIFSRKDIVRRSSKSMIYDPMTIVIALDQDRKAYGTLYVDDGDSYDYKEKDAFARIELTADAPESENILNLRIDVLGNAGLLNENSLKVNQIIFIHPKGSVELRVDLCLKENLSLKLALNQ